MPGQSRNGWHRRNSDSPAAKARKREYNSTEYRNAKAAARRQVNAGHAHCWRCSTHLPPGAPWHLGHDDHDRNIIRGPECPPCNLRTAARRGNQASRRTTNSHTPRRTRTW